jgi:replicative DNA helicase
MTSIRTKARQMASEVELKGIVIDYLQLLRSGGGRKYESRQQEVSDISRSIKLLAKELNIPVFALSQLNREAEKRSDRKPQASDLRESGAIEQDSDLIVLIHREDAYEKESPRAGEADFIVAKNRSGPTATITVAFQGHYSRFVDMTRD